jgi:uncharacterized membrane protein YhhN
MGKRFWLVAYGICFAADLLFVGLQRPDARIVTKPLLMILLGLYYFTASAKGKERTLILPALFFSWLGDLLLLRDNQPLFFMLGLGAFLTAHIFYILYFLRVGGGGRSSLPPPHPHGTLSGYCSSSCMQAHWCTCCTRDWAI